MKYQAPPTPGAAPGRGGRRAWLARTLRLAAGLGGAGALAIPAAGRAGTGAATGTGTATAGAPSAATGADGLPRLARGVNASRWFEYERTLGPDAAELAQLAACGFDHVRIPLDPVACGWQPAQPAQLPFLGALRQALAACHAAGLAVLLDLHLEPADKARLEAEPAREAALLALWQALAGALAGQPRALLALQLFNEPQYYGRETPRWAPLQRRLLAAVREPLPGHLLLLSPPLGGSLAGLLAMTPEPGGALAWTVHHYEPFLFTHQGVPWLDERWTAAGLVTGLDYPARADAPEVVRYLRPHQGAWAAVAAYAREGWNARRIAASLQPAADWARRHGQRLQCTEFGVFRATVPPEARARWLADSRQALQALGIGWTVWDYCDHFGLTTGLTTGPGTGVARSPGTARPAARAAGSGASLPRRRLDPLLLRALGLAPAEAGVPAGASGPASPAARPPHG